MLTGDSHVTHTNWRCYSYISVEIKQELACTQTGTEQLIFMANSVLLTTSYSVVQHNCGVISFSLKYLESEIPV